MPLSDAVTRAADLAALGFAGALDREQIEGLREALAQDPDARARGAALGALVRASPSDALLGWPGALADPAGLDAILHACSDRPAVRRRAVLALAPFSGPAVDAAIAAARDDHDWQVRQAAEDLDQS